ncbi:MAG: dTDP-3-amino-3,4,6-trideoxy-alpha-D-glucose transaminase [Chroococcopsis gigantea SAG 12.99]|nr:dTDP-3-amino-3,4,6-trideoxy-alpha-D-glucose transaminase [Chroococcopsis gigantea SAG 12.99]
MIAGGDFVLGKALKDFENAFAKACGVDHGVGVANGTSAIALGLQAYGIGYGDEVIVPDNTFIATVIGVLQTGARPILVDCDQATALIDLKAAEKAITSKTKAILPVHLYGQMVSPSALLHLARTYNLLVFEDAAQAHLANREGYRAGSMGGAAAFSFYPSKNLGAFGNGGMLVTGEEAIAQRVSALRNYGAPSKYFHTELGTNSRLDTIQAAILEVKLPHLESWNQQRYQIAQYYDYLLAPFADKGIYPITNESGSGHVYHLYVIRLDRSCPIDRQQLQSELNNSGIQTGIHYPIPCHLQPAYNFLGYEKGDFPQAEKLCQEILSLPMYPGLKEEQVNFVIDHLSRIIG